MSEDIGESLIRRIENGDRVAMHEIERTLRQLRAELAAERGRRAEYARALAETAAERDALRTNLRDELERADAWHKMFLQTQKHNDALRAELEAERERNAKLAEDNIRRSNGIVQVEAERDVLRAELAAERERNAAPPYVFRRFRGGNEMAEGVIIENAETLEHAIAKAARFYPGTGTVLVIEDVAARAERDALRELLREAREAWAELVDYPDYVVSNRARAMLNKGGGDE